MNGIPQDPRSPSRELKDRQAVLSTATVKAFEVINKIIKNEPSGSEKSLSDAERQMVRAAFEHVKFEYIPKLSEETISALPASDDGSFTLHDAADVISLKMLGYLVQNVTSTEQLINIIQKFHEFFDILSFETRGNAVNQTRERLMKRPKL